MALIPCKECGAEISTDAKTCPRCGARVKPKSKAWMWVLGVPLGLFVVFAFMGSRDPRVQAMQRDRKPIELCMADLEDPLKSPGFKAAARGVCEQLRDDFVRKYGREP